MMIVKALADTRRFMITHSILWILIVIALGVNIWLLLPMLFTGSGAQTANSIKLPANYCLPLDAQARLRLITERPNDYLECLKRVMK
jgi:hypothetical protein